MSKKILPYAFHFTSALTEKAPVVKIDAIPFSFKENLKFRNDLEQHSKLQLDSKIRCNMHWLKVMNEIRSNEKIITERTKSGELIEIVVDEHGKYKRIL